MVRIVLVLLLCLLPETASAQSLTVPGSAQTAPVPLATSARLSEAAEALSVAKDTSSMIGRSLIRANGIAAR